MTSLSGLSVSQEDFEMPAEIQASYFPHPAMDNYSHWRLTVPWTGQGRLFQYLFVARDESVQPCGYDMTEHESVILESTFPLDSFSEYAFVNDHLGTTRWILDVADGSVQWPEVPGSPGEPYMDTPFGMARNLDEEQDHRNDFRISGKERIPETPWCSPDCAVGICYSLENAAPTLVSRFCSFNVFHEYASLAKSLQLRVSQAFSSPRDDSNSTVRVCFEARFLKAAGPPRFISPDPSLSTSFSYTDPRSFNLYSYCLNNPVNLADENGKWPKPVHELIIDNTFGPLGPFNLSNNLRNVLKQASSDADSPILEYSKIAFMHAMRDPGQSVEDAREDYEAFLNRQEAKFRILMSQGEEEKAYYELGLALHAIADSTTPSHEGFQVWRGYLPLNSSLPHYKRERDPVFNANIQYLLRVRALLLAYYERVSE